MGRAPRLSAIRINDDCRKAARTAVTEIVATLPTSLTGTYRAILAAAPYARLVVLGYPQLFEETDACPASRWT